MADLVDDIKDQSGQWIKTFRVAGIQYITKSAAAWYRMKTRCKPGGSYQKEFPTYGGCSIGQNFQNFQFFAAWYMSQIGYDREGYQLDKDLLEEGNKEYNESRCCLLPRDLNSFLTFGDGARGDLPLGVSLTKGNSVLRYVAQMHTYGVHKRLGSFATPEEAHLAYKTEKEAEARRWAGRLVGGIDVDPRVIARLKEWTLPTRYQFNIGETK